MDNRAMFMGKLYREKLSLPMPGAMQNQFDNKSNTHKRSGMDVKLTPASEQFVRRKLECGNFESANDVITAALSLLEQQEQTWSDQIEIGWQQAKSGQLLTPAELDANLATMKSQWKAAQSHK